MILFSMNHLPGMPEMPGGGGGGMGNMMSSMMSKSELLLYSLPFFNYVITSFFHAVNIANS